MSSRKDKYHWSNFPRKKDRLAVIGFSPTTRDLTPWDDPEVETITLNEGYAFDWVKRPTDRHFQIHPRWDYTRENNLNHFNHWLWLQNKSGQCIRCKGQGYWERKDPTSGEMVTVTCPECENGIYTPPPERENLIIYMQEHWDDIPGSVAYPLKEVMELLPPNLHQRDYFTSSAALILALAFLMGYPRVEFYGFEMGTNTEYHYQRANFEYLVGYFSGRGMDIYVPEKSTLMRGELYGYKNMRIGFRQNLEMRDKILEAQVSSQQQVVDKFTGRIQQLQELVNAGIDVKEVLEEKLKEYQKEIGLYNLVKGARREAENLINLYDHYFVSGSEEGAVNGEEIQTLVKTAYANK